MSYYHVPTMTERYPGSLERKLADDRLLGPPPDTGWTPELAALCGFLVVLDEGQPADTATTTHDRTVEVIAGTPTAVYVERAKTAAELAPAPGPKAATIEDLSALIDGTTSLARARETLRAMLDAFASGTI